MDSFQGKLKRHVIVRWATAFDMMGSVQPVDVPMYVETTFADVVNDSGLRQPSWLKQWATYKSEDMRPSKGHGEEVKMETDSASEEAGPATASDRHSTAGCQEESTTSHHQLGEVHHGKPIQSPSYNISSHGSSWNTLY